MYTLVSLWNRMADRTDLMSQVAVGLINQCLYPVIHSFIYENLFETLSTLGTLNFQDEK